jgi:hypothetical protein
VILMIKNNSENMIPQKGYYNLMIQ